MTEQPPYPYSDGSRAVLGPDVYATADGETIEWQGAIYRRDRGEAGEQAIARVRALHTAAHDWSWKPLGCQHDGAHDAPCRHCRGQCWPCPTIDALEGRPPGHDGETGSDGPSVAECAANDAAHWADKYAGEDT